MGALRPASKCQPHTDNVLGGEVLGVAVGNGV